MKRVPQSLVITTILIWIYVLFTLMSMAPNLASAAALFFIVAALCSTLMFATTHNFKNWRF